MPNSLYYDIDARDRICAVSENWNSVAQSQSGEQVQSNLILGRTVWSFFAGPDTRSYFEKIFAFARESRRKVVLPYRCDSPMMVRSFSMEITPLENDHLRVAHLDLPEKAQPFAIIHIHKAPAEKICAICLSNYRAGQWHDDYFSPRGHVEPDNYTVCPSCQRNAEYE